MEELTAKYKEILEKIKNGEKLEREETEFLEGLTTSFKQEATRGDESGLSTNFHDSNKKPLDKEAIADITGKENKGKIKVTGSGLEDERKKNSELSEKEPEVANSPITTNGADNGWSKEKLFGYTKEINNLFNLLASDDEKNGEVVTEMVRTPTKDNPNKSKVLYKQKSDYPHELLERLLDAKEKGLSFGEALPSEDRRKINERLGGNPTSLKNVMSRMLTVYNSDEFGNLRQQLAMLNTKKNRANTQAARAAERLAEAVDLDALKDTGKLVPSKQTDESLFKKNKKGEALLKGGDAGELEDSSTSFKRLNRQDSATQLQKLTSGGNKVSAALRNAAQHYADLSEQDLGENVTNMLKAAAGANMTPDEWAKVINNASSIKNYVVPATIRNGIMAILVRNKDDEAGKEDKVLHLNPADRKNFLEAWQAVKAKRLEEYNKENTAKANKRAEDTQAGKELNLADYEMPDFKKSAYAMPEFVTRYTNPRNKSVDVGDEATGARANLIRDSFDKMLETGEDRYVFADPAVKSFIDESVTDNGTAFKTETARNKDAAGGAQVTNEDNYLNHLMNIINKGSDEQLDEYLNDEPLTMSKISSDPDNIPDVLNPVYDEDQYIRNNFGDEQAEKARQLYKDIIDLQRTVSPDEVFDKGMFTPGVLRMLASRFKKLREDNPGMPYVKDILSSGDIGDTFGKVHPKADRLKVILGNLLTRDYINRNQEPIDWKGFSRAVTDNIGKLSQAIDSNDFTGLGEGMDKDTAEEILGYLNEAKDFTLTNNDIAKRAKGIDQKSISGLKTLAEISPEELAKAEENLATAIEILNHDTQLAKDENLGKTYYDTTIAKDKKEVDEARSKVDYLKNTRVDLEEQAAKTGKSYSEVLDDYVHPDWEEDDIDSIIAKYDLTNALKERYGNNVLGNSSKKSDHLADLLDKFADVYPGLGLAKWRDKLANWTKPLTPTELYGPKSSYNLAKEAIPKLTPELWSAMVNNNALYSTDTEDRRRNTIYTGMPKTQAGAAHTMEESKNKLAKTIQMADYLDDKELVPGRAKVIEQKLKDAGKPYTKGDEIMDRINKAANILRGIRLDTPGASDE